MLRAVGGGAAIGLSMVLSALAPGCTDFTDLGPPQADAGDAAAQDAAPADDAGGDAPDASSLRATAVAVGTYHACAILAGGDVACWGMNDRGQLGNGDGTKTERHAPVRVQGLPAAAKSLALGGDHSCAVLTDGHLACWGSNHEGELGDSTQYDRTSPVIVTRFIRVSPVLDGLANVPLANVASAAADSRHTCAVLSTGGVMCWGTNGNGELGAGAALAAAPSPAAVPVEGLASGVTMIALGYGRNCALLTDGSVRCWGLNDAGQLGDGTTTNQPSPVEILPAAARVSSVSVGWKHTCVLVANAVRCRGVNSYGQLGDGTFADDLSWASPVPWVSGLGADVSDIVSSAYHSCAGRVSTGSLACWGGNNLGQIGDGATQLMESAPRDVVDLSSGVKSFAAGDQNSCAVLQSGEVRCWGANDHGQLGAASTDSCDFGYGPAACSRTPVTVGDVQ